MNEKREPTGCGDGCSHPDCCRSEREYLTTPRTDRKTPCGALCMDGIDGVGEACRECRP